jgi:SAM-dependent methyltransferase
LEIQDQYNDSYYQERYLKTLTAKLGINNVYYYWIVMFCLIRALPQRKNARVLDFGCGIGNYVRILRRFGVDAYGVDSSLGAKKYCQIADFCIYCTNQILPFPDKHFDLVYSNEVLEHIAPEKLDICLQELQRVSKGPIIHMIAVKERGAVVLNDKTHLIIENESWWKNKFLTMNYKVKIGNLFYFFPHSTEKWSNKGYFFLSKN